MAKNVNLDKQVDGRSKSWGVAPLINHILFDVQLVTSLERGMVRTGVESGTRTSCMLLSMLGNPSLAELLGHVRGVNKL